MLKLINYCIFCTFILAFNSKLGIGIEGDIVKKIILVLFCILVLLDKPAYAYLDPATGSMIIQSLVASIAGFLIFFKSLKNTIISFFWGDKKESDAQIDENQK